MGGITALATVGGKIYGGTRATGHLFVYDPATGASTDLGQASAYSDQIGALTVHAGKLYGGAGDTGRLFVYDPVTRRTTDLGMAVAGEYAIHALATGADGKIYGGTGRAGHLFAYDPVAHNFSDTGVEAPGDAIYALAATADGALYGGTQGGYLFAYRPATGNLAALGQPIPGESAIYALALGADGWLYGGTGSRRGHLFTYDPVTGTTVDKGRASWAYPFIQALVRGADGTIYGGTSELVVYDPADHPYVSPGTATSVDIIPGVRALANEPSNEVVALHQGHDGRIYFGSSRDGHLSAYDPGTGILTDLGRPVANAYYTYALTTGGDGQIYGGTASPAHLYVYHPATGALADLGQPVPFETAVSALTPGNDGKIYGGTWGYDDSRSGRFFVYDPGTGTLSDKGQAVSGDRGISALTTGADDRIYGGTFGGHIFVFDPTSATLADLGTGVPGDSAIVALITDADGVIYGRDYLSALFSFRPDTGVFTDLGNPGWADFFVTSLAIADGVVYGTSWLPQGRQRTVLFGHEISSGTTRIIGEPVVGARAMHAITTGSDGRVYSHTWTRDMPSHLVAYDPQYTFGWDTVRFSADTPPNTALDVAILGAGSMLLDHVQSGGSLAGLDPARQPSIQLHAELTSSHGAATPRLLEWSVTWWTVAVEPQVVSFLRTTKDPAVVTTALDLGTTSATPVTWTAQTDRAWLRVYPDAGAAPAALTLAADKTGLATDVRHTGTVTINWHRASEQGAIEVAVSLLITEVYAAYLPLLLR